MTCRYLQDLRHNAAKPRLTAAPKSNQQSRGEACKVRLRASPESLTFFWFDCLLYQTVYGVG